MKKLLHILLLMALLLPCPGKSAAQSRGFMPYRIGPDGDTVFVDVIKPSYIYTGKKKGRKWRKYYRLVRNFAKTYPYALQAGQLVREVDSVTAADNLRGRRREQYITAIQNNIIRNYEKVIRDMTISQGKLLIVLIGRESGLTPYEIIHDYKSGMAAGFWQGIARLFGGDLKKAYDPEEEDRAVEELVALWEKGEFEGLYYSIFGEDAPMAKVADVSVSPSKRK